jgi:hypothetical protein
MEGKKCTGSYIRKKEKNKRKWVKGVENDGDRGKALTLVT